MKSGNWYTCSDPPDSPADLAHKEAAVRNLILLLPALVLLVYVGVADAANLEIHTIDVGEGDCTLVISPTGTTLLIDGGDTGKGARIISYLGGLGVSSLTYTVATHYHADHIGGLDEVLNGGISITGAAYDRGGSYSSQAFDQYKAAVGNKRATIRDGDVIDLGGGATAKCVAVNGNGVPGVSDDNDLCVALKISYNNFDFFVAGDLSGTNDGGYKDVETSVAPEVGDIEVYRVDHHGSSYSTNQYFLDTLDPEVSILSLGKNSYGHPTSSVVTRLAATSDIYQTEDARGRVIDGDIPIVTDGASSFSVDGHNYQMSGGGGGSFHIAGITVSLQSKGKSTWAVAQVTIVDANEQPVGSATVNSHWSGLTSDSDQFLTGSDGKGSASSDKRTNPVGWFIVSVDNVAKTGWTYDAGANVETADSVSVGSLLAAATETIGLRNEPNPFSTSTSIRYSLRANGYVHLAIYDVTGRMVRTLSDGDKSAGEHVAVWTGTDQRGTQLPSGIYFARLRCRNVTKTQKMFLSH